VRGGRARAGAPARLAGLEHALSQLPENQRRAILLREWQGLSYADIAEQLGTTVAAVETLIFRARRGLSERLEPKRRRRVSALDVGSLLAPLRTLLDGVLGKLAVAAAGVSLALVPVVAKDIAVDANSGTAALAPTPAAAAVRATPRASSVDPASTAPHARPRLSPQRPRAVATRRRVGAPRSPRPAAPAPEPAAAPHPGTASPPAPPPAAPDPAASTGPAPLPLLPAGPALPSLSLPSLPSAPAGLPLP
jgi:hypothetical protein